MRWSYHVCVCLSFAVLAAGCASPKIGYDYDRSARFTDYRTYEWGPDAPHTVGNPRIDNRLLDAHIRSAIVDELHSKGFTTPGQGPPDFYVAYHAGVNDLMKGSSTQNYIGDRAHGTYTTISDIQPYSEGTLLIDIVDAASKQLVWQASATTEADPGMNAEERDRRIRLIVRAMLAPFPPH